MIDRLDDVRVDVRIAVEDTDGSTQAARLGGLELSIGIDIGLWFPVTPRDR